MKRYSILILGAAAALLGTSTVRADEPEPAPAVDAAKRADALFARGMELMNDGKPARACPMFEESLRIDPAIGTLFRLAECHEMTGRIADAHRRFLEVAELARKSGQPEREGVAKQRAAALVSRLAWLSIRVSLDLVVDPELRVTLDGNQVTASAWGKDPIRVALGEHVILATVPGKVPFQRRVDLTEPGKTTEIRVPHLADQGLELQSEAEPSPRIWTTGRIAATVWGGISTSVMVTGFLLAPQNGTAVRTGLIAAGAAGLVSAIPMWFLSTPPAPDRDAVAVRVAPVLAPGMGGATIVGRF